MLYLYTIHISSHSMIVYRYILIGILGIYLFYFYCIYSELTLVVLYIFTTIVTLVVCLLNRC
nr:MAG TPA: hypothetical protein [Caudoviricetes sp.]